MGREKCASFGWIWSGGGALALAVASGCSMPNPAWKDGATVASTPGTGGDDSTSGGSESASGSASSGSTSESSTTMGVVSETDMGTGGTTTGNPTTGMSSDSDSTSLDPTEDTEITGGVECPYTEMLALNHVYNVVSPPEPVENCQTPHVVKLGPGFFTKNNDGTSLTFKNGGIMCQGLPLDDQVEISGPWMMDANLPVDSCGRLEIWFAGEQCSLVAFKILHPSDNAALPFFAVSRWDQPVDLADPYDITPELDTVAPPLCTTNKQCGGEFSDEGEYKLAWRGQSCAEGASVSAQDGDLLNLASRQVIQGSECVREIAWVYRRK